MSNDKEEGDGDASKKSLDNDAHKVENNDVNGMEDHPDETNGDVEKEGTEDMEAEPEPEPIAAES